MESTHGKLHFTAPLTAITAAVVGVIASLALFFLAYVLWPEGTGAGWWWTVDLVALILVLAAAWTLMVARQGVVRVIVVSGLAGWAWQALGGLG